MVAAAPAASSGATQWRTGSRTVTPLNEWMWTATAPRAKRKFGRKNGPAACSVYQPK